MEPQDTPSGAPSDPSDNPFYMPGEDDAVPNGSPPTVKPFIPASKILPEITVKAIVLGILLSVILASANTYLGLFAGMTVSASIPAAVISMAILRAFKKSNILENNIVQTAASAGESLAAGVIFTFPALILLGTWEAFDYWQTTMIAGFGGLLGVLFSIPLRRALIVESPLRFPEGVATAEVLEVGETGGSGVAYIAWSAVIGALFKIGAGGLKLWAEVFEVAGHVKGSIAYFGSNLSPALVGVGFIVGLNIAVLVFIGGAINWFVAIPIVANGMETQVYITVEEAAAIQEADPSRRVIFPLEIRQRLEPMPITDEMTAEQLAEAGAHNAGLAEENAEIDKHNAKLGEPVPAVDLANKIWSKKTRYLGVGAMALGGLWALLRLFPALIRGVRASIGAHSRGPGDEGTKLLRTEHDIPFKWIVILGVLSLIPLFFIFNHITGGNPGIAAFMAVIMLVAGFLFSAVAAYMAGLVGSSNNPISGVTIATILMSSLLLLLLVGRDHPEIGAAAAIMIGATVCCAAAISGDNMQDLKAGQLVGATPYKQQIMQVVGVVSAALVMAPVLMLLLKAYGIGGDPTAEHPEPLAAPQAELMKAVAEGVFENSLPWLIVGIGAIIAAVVIAMDIVLETLKAPFRMPVLAVAVGIYLPFELSVPILLGGLISWLAKRALRHKSPEERQRAARHGLLFAAGLITGEALLGILLAIPVALEVSDAIEIGSGEAAWPGIGLLLVVMAGLYFVARKVTANSKA
ncbi:MAG: oligopeptide transporter, OPT family [Phycisphaerales bacterium]|nr:oligopeptide transporter, OPT family [Phycisphaerales bacterium]